MNGLIQREYTYFELLLELMPCLPNLMPGMWMIVPHIKATIITTPTEHTLINLTNKSFNYLLTGSKIITRKLRIFLSLRVIIEYLISILTSKTSELSGTAFPVHKRRLFPVKQVRSRLFRRMRCQRAIHLQSPWGL